MAERVGFEGAATSSQVVDYESTTSGSGVAGSQRGTHAPVPVCPLLATVIAAWLSLPDPVKSALVSVVSAHAPRVS
jgi:hypothetical protein